jgi:hypothetical protein
MTVRDCCDPWRMKTFHIFRRPSLALPLRLTAMGTSGQCQALYWETRTDWLQVFMTSKSWAIAVTSTWDFVALWEHATKASLRLDRQRKTNATRPTNFFGHVSMTPSKDKHCDMAIVHQALLALFVSLHTLFTYWRVLVISRQNHPVNLASGSHLDGRHATSMTNLESY